MGKLTKSERNKGMDAVPYPLQRSRILSALATGQRESVPTSALAYTAFEGFKFKSPQAAALVIGRTVRRMLNDKVIRLDLYGYQITDKGLKEAEEHTDGQN